MEKLFFGTAGIPCVVSPTQNDLQVHPFCEGIIGG